jgi:hypothetical protein
MLIVRELGFANTAIRQCRPGKPISRWLGIAGRGNRRDLLRPCWNKPCDAQKQKHASKRGNDLGLLRGCGAAVLIPPNVNPDSTPS